MQDEYNLTVLAVSGSGEVDVGVLLEWYALIRLGYQRHLDPIKAASCFLHAMIVPFKSTFMASSVDDQNNTFTIMRRNCEGIVEICSCCENR